MAWRAGLDRVGLLFLVGVLLGCSQAPEPARPKPGQRLPFEGQSLKVIVLDDPGLAEAMRGPVGEFKAQTGAALEIVRRPITELSGADPLEADVLIVPSFALGQLAEAKHILPVPSGVLEDPALRWSDVFEATRLHEAVWGQKPYALPMGSATLVCWYRDDLLKKFNRAPPQTWAEYQDLAAFFADRANLGDAAPPVGQPWHGALEPLGPRWAGLTLLARAASYAKHRDHYSTMFNIDTMAPLIDRPPFVRALEELAAVAKLGPPEMLKFSPSDVRAAFWEGQCALALTWTSGAEREELPPPPTESFAVGFDELPGSTEVYNPGAGKWDERRESVVRRVPLLAASGRLGVVTAQCRYREAAWQLLKLLVSDPWCTQVCSASSATSLFRQSQVAKPTAWVERGMDPEAARRYADAVRLVMSRQEFVPALRMPGRLQYLDELDRAVQRVVRGEAKASEALAKVAEQWRFITDETGDKSQRLALLRGLGLSE